MKAIAYQNMCLHFIPGIWAQHILGRTDLEHGPNTVKSDFQWAVTTNADQSENLHVRFRKYDKTPLSRLGWTRDLILGILSFGYPAKYTHERFAEQKKRQLDRIPRTFESAYEQIMDFDKKCPVKKPEFIENGCDYFEKRDKGI